jgi:uncharacterized protein
VSEQAAASADPVAAAAWADPDTRTYWTGLNSGHITLRRCHECGHAHLPPMPSCPNCGRSGTLSDTASTGRGRIYSWVVAHYPFDEAQKDEVPFVIGAIDLEEGVRVFGRIWHVDLDADLSELPVVARPVPGREGRLPMLVFVPQPESSGQ